MQAICSEPSTLLMLPVTALTHRFQMRRLSASGLRRLQESMQHSGFLDAHPLVVMALDEHTYQLIDGHHRYAAALALGLPQVPCMVKPPMTPQECYALAWQLNEATEVNVPTTLVVCAEWVWKLAKEGFTQVQIAEMLRWSREKVKNYAALRQLSDDAWEIIGTTLERGVPTDEDEAVPGGGTGVPPFTEGLLRALLDLTPAQQVELVTDLAAARISKSKCKAQAEAYRTRRQMFTYASRQLGEVGEGYLTRLQEELACGAYDADWKTSDHPKLHKLMESLRDEWEHHHRIQLIQGDFYEEVKKVKDGCVDFILTDPPYNIAREQTFVLEGRTNRSHDFGAWDSYTDAEFLAFLDIWAREWARLLREQGSGYVFTSDRFLSFLRAALGAAGLHVKATLCWYKTNPAPQVVKTNFTSSLEYVLFFTKGEGGHTFNWQGEIEMHNHIVAPVCGGEERLVDAKGKTLHPTQKPEQVLRHLMEISSNRGDTVFDGFAGVGSTCAVAKQLGRKCIGIEQNKIYFEAMQRRLAE